MGKKQQPFFVWYFVVALVVILIVQNFLQSPHLENVTYSQFKSLVKKGLVINPRSLISDQLVREAERFLFSVLKKRS